MSTTREPFEFEYFYHVYNHARGKDNIFNSHRDYVVFMELVSKYILEISQIYAYCLMPNHFHFLVRNRVVVLPDKFASKHEGDFISHQWGNVQNTYSKKKNYRSGRRGGLFCQSINRNLITSEEYLQMGIVYIHNNPVKHGFCSTPEEWEFSSFKAIVSEKKTNVEREEVLYWFENKENFVQYHKSNVDDIFVEKYHLS